ncbi:unnamed protein product [Brachionus calyciflorus]|uniref:Gustatory receptor n=1 Tax=Brachionus calyciflorus TaxID=104777 RepID=A0A813Y7Q5_9BILA|nr:unnamed protein product [Brachionus calyciflorus]
MSFQLPILIIATLLVTQIVNCMLDQFFLLGICQLIHILTEQFEEDKRKEEEDAEKYKNSFFRKKIKETFNAGYLKVLPNFKNLENYGLALLNILIGIIFIVYFMTVIVKLWRLWASKSSGCILNLLSYPRSYIFLIVTIIINIGFIFLFIYLNGKMKLKHDENLRVYDEFKQDFIKISKHNKPNEKENTILNINHSITRLKLFFQLNNFNYMTTVVSIILLSLFLIMFLITNLF